MPDGSLAVRLGPWHNGVGGVNPLECGFVGSNMSIHVTV